MGMARVIDVDALGIGKAKREVFENPAYADGWNSVIEIIENAPTVDAVEVVRCKDCKHSSGTRIEPNTCVCFKHGIIMFADHFCAWGERRNNE